MIWLVILPMCRRSIIVCWAGRINKENTALEEYPAPCFSPYGD
jgi:hypothetical protein